MKTDGKDKVLLKTLKVKQSSLDLMKQNMYIFFNVENDIMKVVLRCIIKKYLAEVK